MLGQFNRPIVRRIFLSTLATGGLLGGYMRFFEPKNLKIGHHKIQLGEKAAETIRIAHLSDFHASEFVSLEFIEKAVDVATSLQPDVVCLTGDFITWEYENFPRYSKVLKKLAQVAPAFACLGNHDGGNWAARTKGYKTWDNVAGMLFSSQVTLLHNKAATISVRDQKLQIVGLGDLWSKECDPLTGFKNTSPNLSTLVLSHNPDSKELLRGFKWSLMLCGHTHGGQLSIPLLGEPFAPIRDRRYVAGLNRYDQRWIHTTRGVGNLHGLRLNRPPEVSLLEIS